MDLEKTEGIWLMKAQEDALMEAVWNCDFDTGRMDVVSNFLGEDRFITPKTFAYISYQMGHDDGRSELSKFIGGRVVPRPVEPSLISQREYFMIGTIITLAAWVTYFLTIAA
jgi:hypothetical protein